MSDKKTNNEKANKLFSEYLNEISSNENAESYLKSEGLDPDKLVADGIRKIKQLKMKLASAKTQGAFLSLTSALMEQAKEEARKLMGGSSFNFAQFVKKEGITVAYRNLESLTEEEIREFLEKHILLKLQAQSNTDEKKDNAF